MPAGSREEEILERDEDALFALGGHLRGEALGY